MWQSPREVFNPRNTTWQDYSTYFKTEILEKFAKQTNIYVQNLKTFRNNRC